MKKPGFDAVEYAADRRDGFIQDEGNFREGLLVQIVKFHDSPFGDGQFTEEILEVTGSHMFGCDWPGTVVDGGPENFG